MVSGAPEEIGPLDRLGQAGSQCDQQLSPAFCFGGRDLLVSLKAIGPTKLVVDLFGGIKLRSYLDRFVRIAFSRHRTDDFFDDLEALFAEERIAIVIPALSLRSCDPGKFSSGSGTVLNVY